jgi:hypothetical protein
MILDNIYKAEIITIVVEQVEDIEKWKPLLLELAGRDIYVTINEEMAVTEFNFMNEEGSTTIEIICSVEEFIEFVPRLRELDEEGMLSVLRTYHELEDFYYNEEEE